MRRHYPGEYAAFHQ
jgi:hypothetical protein